MREKHVGRVSGYIVGYEPDTGPDVLARRQTIRGPRDQNYSGHAAPSTYTSGSGWLSMLVFCTIHQHVSVLSGTYIDIWFDIGLSFSERGRC